MKPLNAVHPGIFSFPPSAEDGHERNWKTLFLETQEWVATHGMIPNPGAGDRLYRWYRRQVKRVIPGVRSPQPRIMITLNYWLSWWVCSVRILHFEAFICKTY